MKTTITLLLAFITFASFAQEPLESDFFNDGIDKVSKTVNLVEDYGANGADEADDSQALQKAIDDMTKLPNGGKIIIPPGTFLISGITMESNVHIVIDTTATLKSSQTSGNMFFFGYNANKKPDAAITVSNISIRSNSTKGGKYTVDYSHAPRNPNKINLVVCKNVKNFLLSDFLIKDNQTMLSCITASYITDKTNYWMPENGVIKNGDVEFSHYGYGLVQAQVGKNILFKDIAGEGGITLRLESGAVAASPNYILTDSIYGRNISVRNGHGAVMLGPHTKKNGHVDIDGVLAVSSNYAVAVGGGYTTKEEDSLGYTPGRFANTCIFANIHAVYGENAEHKTKNFDEVPCAIRHLISPEPIYDGKIYRGPSATICKSTCDEKENPYTVTWKNITMEGFEHQFREVTRLADQLAEAECYDPPVNGLKLHYDTVKVNLGSTITIDDGITPANAEHKNVAWSSADVLIATVNNQGLVTPVNMGITTIYAVAEDGGYSDSCLVKVDSAPTHLNNLVEDKKHNCVLYPNPATTELYIKNKNVVAVEIYNTAGIKVKSVPHIQPAHSISLKGLLPGLYVLITKMKDNQESQLFRIE